MLSNHQWPLYPDLSAALTAVLTTKPRWAAISRHESLSSCKLEWKGYEVAAAKSGQAAVAQIGRQFDLVILDYNLPDISGDVVADLLEARASFRAHLHGFGLRSPSCPYARPRQCPSHERLADRFVLGNDFRVDQDRAMTRGFEPPLVKVCPQRSRNFNATAA